MAAARAAIAVTHSAWAKMGSIMRASNNRLGFLYAATSGGCSGLNFELTLLDEPPPKTRFGPLVLDNPDAAAAARRVYVDPESELYLLGTTIDYVREDYAKAQYENRFVFRVDKKTATTCGCGTSFTPRSMP